jgi:hypothetical protein
MIGSVIGAGASAVTSGSAARRSDDASHYGAGKAKEYLGKSSGQIDETNQELNDLLSQYSDTIDQATGGQSTVDKRNEMINDYNADDYTYKSSDFDYDKTIEDFYDPAQQMNVDTAMRGINSSQANAGGLFSSGTLNKLQSKAETMATNAYDEARNAYNTDKSLASSIWGTTEGNKQAETTSAANAYDTGYNQVNTLANQYVDEQGNIVTQASNNAQNNLQNNLDLNNNYAQIAASDPGKGSTTLQRVLDPGGFIW